LSSKKRKRSTSNLAKTNPNDLPAPQPTKTSISSIIDNDTLLPSTPDVGNELSNSPILGKVLSNEDRLGSASPRSIAVRQFSRLAIAESDQSRNELHPTLAPVSDDALPIPQPTDLRLDSLNAIRFEESSTPPAKRLPPPRGIKSPRPRHRTSPFTPPAAIPSSQRHHYQPSTPPLTSVLDPPLSPPTSATTSPSDAPLFDFDFDFRALTWQDSEITGHLMLDPDDDGTGLNGLGFRPTATQQVARSQRRRKQVLEWKARQAREERERRAQKRRELEHIGAASVGMQKMEDHAGGAGAKKVVRFAV
jgi:hypothetical protein